MIKKIGTMCFILLIMLTCSIGIVFAEDDNWPNWPFEGDKICYKNAKYGFKFCYDGDWILESNNNTMPVVRLYSTSEPKEEFCPNFGVIVADLSDRANVSLEECVNRLITITKRQDTNYELIKNEPITLPNHQPAIKHIFKYKKKSYRQQMSVYTLHNDKFYSITFFSNPEQFDKYKDEIDQIINSFVFY